MPAEGSRCNGRDTDLLHRGGQAVLVPEDSAVNTANVLGTTSAASSVIVGGTHRMVPAVTTASTAMRRPTSLLLPHAMSLGMPTAAAQCLTSGTQLASLHQVHSPHGIVSLQSQPSVSRQCQPTTLQCSQQCPQMPPQFLSCKYLTSVPSESQLSGPVVLESEPPFAITSKAMVPMTYSLCNTSNTPSCILTPNTLSPATPIGNSPSFQHYTSPSTSSYKSVNCMSHTRNFAPLPTIVTGDFVSTTDTLTHTSSSVLTPVTPNKQNSSTSTATTPIFPHKETSELSPLLLSCNQFEKNSPSVITRQHPEIDPTLQFLVDTKSSLAPDCLSMVPCTVASVHQTPNAVDHSLQSVSSIQENLFESIKLPPSFSCVSSPYPIDSPSLSSLRSHSMPACSSGSDDTNFMLNRSPSLPSLSTTSCYRSNFLQKDLSFDYFENSNHIIDNVVSTGSFSATKEALNVNLWMTVPPSPPGAESGNDTCQSFQGYETTPILSSDGESETEEHEVEEAAFVSNTSTPSPLQDLFEEYEPASDMDDAVVAEYSDSDIDVIDTRFTMSAIVVSEDIDSQLSDEFADQSNVTDSEGEFSDELDMAGFFVAFKKVHHKRGAISHHPMRFLSTGLSESENDFDADRWKCLECNQVNNRSFFRYCEKCWKMRRNWLADPPKKRKQKARHRPRRRRRSNSTKSSGKHATAAGNLLCASNEPHDTRKAGTAVNNEASSASTIAETGANSLTGSIVSTSAASEYTGLMNCHRKYLTKTDYASFDGPSTSDVSKLFPKFNSLCDAQDTSHWETNVSNEDDTLKSFMSMARIISVPTSFSAEKTNFITASSRDELNMTNVKKEASTNSVANGNSLLEIIHTTKKRKISSSDSDIDCKENKVRKRTVSTASTVSIDGDMSPDYLDIDVNEEEDNNSVMLDHLNGIVLMTSSTNKVARTCSSGSMENIMHPVDMDTDLQLVKSAQLTPESGIGSSQDLLLESSQEGLDYATFTQKSEDESCDDIPRVERASSASNSDNGYNDTIIEGNATAAGSSKTSNEYFKVRGSKKKPGNISHDLNINNNVCKNPIVKYMNDAILLANDKNVDVRTASEDHPVKIVSNAIVEFLHSSGGQQWITSPIGRSWCNTPDVQASILASLTQATTPEENLCIMCQDRIKDTAIIHGKISHQATCYTCAKELFDRKQRCPVCRRKILRISKNIII